MSTRAVNLSRRDSDSGRSDEIEERDSDEEVREEEEDAYGDTPASFSSTIETLTIGIKLFSVPGFWKFALSSLPSSQALRSSEFFGSCRNQDIMKVAVIGSGVSGLAATWVRCPSRWF